MNGFASSLVAKMLRDNATDHGPHATWPADGYLGRDWVPGLGLGTHSGIGYPGRVLLSPIPRSLSADTLTSSDPQLLLREGSGPETILSPFRIL